VLVADVGLSVELHSMVISRKLHKTDPIIRKSTPLILLPHSEQTPASLGRGEYHFSHLVLDPQSGEDVGIASLTRTAASSSGTCASYAWA